MSSLKASDHVINCNAGPARLPVEVLRKAQEELIQYRDTGISVMEMSHRSPEFEHIVQTSEKLLREIMNIPDNYRVLFMHGGGTAQFASIPLNLCKEFKADKVNYVVTGTWSAKAAWEAEKYCNVNRVTPKTEKYLSIPDASTWNVDPEGKYLYCTDNETIAGIEYQFQVEPFSDRMPVCIDMTSNFLSRPVDVSKYGVIIAGTQKNAGIAALAVVIVRDDLIGKPMSICPSILDYTMLNKMKSLYNTPACFPIYMTMLTLQWIKDQGGLDEMGRRASLRSKYIYDVIDGSNGFYYNGVDKNCRSRINAVFRIGGPDGNELLEKQFIQECRQLNVIGVKGHRLVGGIRISMFNAMPVDDAKYIADFMLEFMERNRQQQ